MPKITSLEPQKNNPHRFNIFLDGEFVFGADEDLVVKRRLIVGKIIESSDLEKILLEAEVGKLMEKMYRLWNVRQRSEKEVCDYFRIKNKQVSKLTLDTLIINLKRKGMINDLEFAKSWVEARRRSKQKGIRAIKAELYQKGITKEIIEEVVSVQVTGYSEEELARQALQKKMKIWKNLDSKKLYQKSIEFLLRKGFEFELSRKTVEMILKKE